jgi:hypothetical protein
MVFVFTYLVTDATFKQRIEGGGESTPKQPCEIYDNLGSRIILPWYVIVFDRK